MQWLRGVRSHVALQVWKAGAPSDFPPPAPEPLNPITWPASNDTEITVFATLIALKV